MELEFRGIKNTSNRASLFRNIIKKLIQKHWFNNRWSLLHLKEKRFNTGSIKFSSSSNSGSIQEKTFTGSAQIE